MLKRCNPILRLSFFIVSIVLLTSCNMLTRLAEMKEGPKVSEISNPVSRPKYRPVSMPMPMPKNVVRKLILNSGRFLSLGLSAQKT